MAPRTMLKTGTPLGAPEIAIVASAGLGRVRVEQPTAFMVISTGDELVEPANPSRATRFGRSNTYAVIATLRARRIRTGRATTICATTKPCSPTG